jgi:uncharacterized iron-regulated protein
MLLLSVLSIGVLNAQLLPNYALFDAKGGKITHKKLIGLTRNADVILFGELHNNSVAHWLQLKLVKELAANGPLVLGAEMIEADDQVTLDRYLRSEIDREAFDSLARLWPNYATDYAPLVEFARGNKLPFIATNVPRRYARAVSRGGYEALDTVPEPERKWIAPLPITFDPTLPRYVHMLEMMEGHGTPDMVKAQALKDATMAHFILHALQPGTRFLHFNGSFHSDHYEGIGWYLRQARPEIRQITIATVTQEQLKTLDAEHLGSADVILVVDADMPGSH